VDPRDVRWAIASGFVLAASLALRLSNVFRLAPLRDYDGSGHALNIVALYDGNLPEPSSWSGFHPPLYHATAALAWHVVGDTLPSHVVFRLVSLIAGVAALVLVWVTLRRFVETPTAWVVTACVGASPVFSIATTMLGNETMCTLWVTALLAASTWERPENVGIRSGLRSGILGGLAVLTKATGAVAVAANSLVLAFRLRSRPRVAAGAVLLAGVIPLLMLAPFYARLLKETNSSLLGVVSGGAISREAGTEMASQAPGDRRLSDYWSVPASTFTAPSIDDPALQRTVTALLFTTIWADGQGQFLPADPHGAVPRALVIFGLLPTALALAGLWRMARRPRDYAWAAAPMAFAAVLTLAFLRYTWVLPRFSAVKASYLLPALLPASIALALGIEALRGPARGAIRILLLAGALFTSSALWLGWWT
jgi:4-amino-4-deoxy-L-arabinose transferase-like glycosyltransferase